MTFAHGLRMYHALHYITDMACQLALVQSANDSGLELILSTDAVHTNALVKPLQQRIFNA